MNSEETIFDPQMNDKTSDMNKNSDNKPQKSNKTGLGEKLAYGVGGAALGVAATLGGQAMAAEKPENDEEAKPEEIKPEEVTAEEATADATATADTADTADAAAQASEAAQAAEAAAEAAKAQALRAEAAADTATAKVEAVNVSTEDNIIATQTGVRVAHVDQEDSFADAFADARAQVGPGGVFEWNGRVYGTYYKNEWDSMTPDQRAHFQASVSHSDVNPTSVHTHHDYASTHHTVHHDEPHPSGNSQNVIVEQAPEDVDVRVLHVGVTDLNKDGVPENAAVLEVDGTPAIILDVDLDNRAEILIADANQNGEFDAPDIMDISRAGVPMPAQATAYNPSLSGSDSSSMDQPDKAYDPSMDQPTDSYMADDLPGMVEI